MGIVYTHLNSINHLNVKPFEWLQIMWSVEFSHTADSPKSIATMILSVVDDAAASMLISNSKILLEANGVQSGASGSRFTISDQ